MPKILIVYYNHTRDTEKVAETIAEGAKTVQEVEVELKRYEAPQRLADFDAVLIGAPTCHHTMTNNIKKFLEKVAFHNVDLRVRSEQLLGLTAGVAKPQDWLLK